MDCSCIKGKFDIILDSLNSKTLLYQDISEWMSGARYQLPETYTVQVKSPHSKEFFDVEVPTKGYKTLTAKDLGIGSDGSCLQEGIYSFKTVSCGESYLLYKAITPDLECRLRCMLTQGIDPMRVAELTTQLKSVAYNAERDLIKEANSILKIVKREIDLVECNCSCCS